MKEINICKIAKILCTFALVAMTADVSAMKNKGKSQNTNPNYYVNNSKVEPIINGTGKVAQLLNNKQYQAVVDLIKSQENAYSMIVEHSEVHYQKITRPVFKDLNATHNNKDTHTYFNDLQASNARENSRYVLNKVMYILGRGEFSRLEYSNGNQLDITMKVSDLGLKILGGSVHHWIWTEGRDEPDLYEPKNYNKNTIRCWVNFDRDGETILTTPPAGGAPANSIAGSCYPEANGSLIQIQQ